MEEIKWVVKLDCESFLASGVGESTGETGILWRGFVVGLFGDLEIPRRRDSLLETALFNATVWCVILERFRVPRDSRPSSRVHWSTPILSDCDIYLRGRTRYKYKKVHPVTIKRSIFLNDFELLNWYKIFSNFQF